MSRTYKDSPHHKQARNRGRGRLRHISVRSVRRDPPDLRRLSRAVIGLAMTQADAEAQAAAGDQANQPGETEQAGTESPDDR